MTLRRAALLMALLCAACEPRRTPPDLMIYDGLPVSGSLAFANGKGFTECFNYTAIEVRCRRHNVMLLGQGPYEAAVDLVGGYGEGGFSQLTLWSEGSQEEVYKVTDVLEKQGWQQCMTGTDERGDQLVYTRPGSRVWITMDLSYWAKRRLRVIPGWNRKELRCKPGDKQVGEFLKTPLNLYENKADDEVANMTFNEKGRP